MGKLNFAIDESRCIHCDSCVKECPRRIICDTDPVPSIPPEMEELVIRAYDLSEHDKEKLRKIIIETTAQLKVDLTEMEEKKKKL